MKAECSSRMYVFFCFLIESAYILAIHIYRLPSTLPSPVVSTQKNTQSFCSYKVLFIEIAMFCKKITIQPPVLFFRLFVGMLSERTHWLRLGVVFQTPRRNATMCVVVKRMRPSRAWDVIDPWKNRFGKRHMENRWFPKMRMEINMDFYRRNSLKKWVVFIYMSFLGTWGLQTKQVSGIKQLTQIA